MVYDSDQAFWKYDQNPAIVQKPSAKPHARGAAQSPSLGTKEDPSGGGKTRKGWQHIRFALAIPSHPSILLTSAAAKLAPPLYQQTLWPPSGG